MGVYMSRLSRTLKLALAGALSTPGVLLAPSQALAKVQRPPQYVLLAFDGSQSLSFWKESRGFAKDESQQGKDLKFTYFISGVYFIHKGNRNIYRPPHHKVGASDIGFSETREEIPDRVDQVNRAFDEGHEIGSHANGHFDAADLANRGKGNFAPWSQEDWSSEFAQFNRLIFGAFENNDYKKGQYDFSQRNITGFRAPLLGITPGLRPALKDYGFHYDTSQVNKMSYWPRTDAYGVWNFPLAQLPIVGTGKKTLSMDYNFYFSQSAGAASMVKENPALAEVFYKQMLDSYLNYFQTNYYGNRAPIHIGHHFSKWNKGAYWNAMKDFANAVCGLEEVRCVTYSELANFMDNSSNETINAYQNGDFDLMPRPAQPLFQIADAVKVDVQLKVADGLFKALAPAGRDRKNAVLGFKYEVFVNRQSTGTNEISRKQLSQKFPEGSSFHIGAHVMNGKGLELLSKTFVIRNFNTPEETMTTVPLENKALEGDMNEAHQEVEE